MTKHDDNQEIFRLIGHLANGLRQALNPMQGFLEMSCQVEHLAWWSALLH